MSNTPRIQMLDALRGIAALSVCWYHFTHGTPDFLPDGFLKSSGTYGWLGVEVFFVISGFIIPYTLHRSGYRLKDYFRFVLKRIVRLDAPYLAAILIIIALGYGSARIRGTSYIITVPQVLLHLGYINVLFGYTWLNPVFWSLAIEFQYYLAIGLLFPLLCGNAKSRVGVVAVLSLLLFLPPTTNFISNYVYLFLMGIATFQHWIGMLNRKHYLLMLAVLTGGLVYSLGPMIASVGLVTACLIAFARVRHFGILQFFGTISYSLYLLHVPIGGKIVNLSLRLPQSTGERIATLIVATGSSIAAAYVLNKFVERPSQRLSSSINYREGEKTAFALEMSSADQDPIPDPQSAAR